jgi:hypothetical protein
MMAAMTGQIEVLRCLMKLKVGFYKTTDDGVSAKQVREIAVDD